MRKLMTIKELWLQRCGSNQKLMYSISPLDFARQMEALGHIQMFYTSTKIPPGYTEAEHMTGRPLGWECIYTTLGYKERHSGLPNEIKRTEITDYEEYRSNRRLRAFKLWMRRWGRKLRLIGHTQSGAEAIR